MSQEISAEKPNNYAATILRWSWYGVALFALGILLLSLPQYNRVLSEGYYSDIIVLENAPINTLLNTLIVILSILEAVLAIILSWVLHRYKPNDRMATFASFLFLIASFVAAGPLEVLKPVWPDVIPVVYSLLAGLMTPPSIAFLVLFPDGHFVPAWTRWLFYGSFLSAAFELATSIPAVQSYYLVGWKEILILFTIFIPSFYAQVYRYRNVSSPLQRQQTKWVVFALSLFILPQAVIFLLGLSSPEWLLPRFLLWQFCSLLIFVALTIAIMRYRLYDIDIIINRTLVYGVLTVGIVGLYIVLIAGSGLAVQSNSNLVGVVIATLLVITIIKPLHGGLQRGINRLLYGDVENASPRESMATIEKIVELNRPASKVSFSFWLKGAWFLLFVMVAAILVFSIPGYISSVSKQVFNSYDQFIFDKFVIDEDLSFEVVNLIFAFLSLFTGILSAVLAWLLFRRRSQDRMAVFLSFYLLAYAIGSTGSIGTSPYLWPEFTLSGILFISAIVLAPGSATLLLMFPEGVVKPSWARWLILFSTLVIPYAYASQSSFSSSIESPFVAAAGLIGSAAVLSALFILLNRYRKDFTATQKQQTKWVIYGLVAFVALQLLSLLPFALLQMLPDGSPLPWWWPASTFFYLSSLAIVPVTFTIAVMRYQLYDIDIILNRTLVYGVLTAITMGIYVLVVGYLGNLVQTQNNSFIAFLTTGLVALLFNPIRERLQLAVNRFMYGERDDPVSVLTKLGKQLEETVSPKEALSRIVETIAQTMKLPYAAIEFGVGKEANIIASFGHPVEDITRFPIIYQTQKIGDLIISSRSPGESFSDKDNIVLENIARQAGTAAQAAKLTADLQRSRQRLVTAREEERRRLRRDLHDGIGPTMAGHTLKLDAAIEMIAGDPDSGQGQDLEEAISLLTDLKEQTQQSVKNIRQMVYELRPSSLDDLGLVAAIQTHVDQLLVSKQGLRITIEKSLQNILRLSAAVELAAYRIVLEALTNVISHAQAQECEVKIGFSENGSRMLELEIIDDGIGLPKNYQTGIGLSSMRERAEELGGTFFIGSGKFKGTRVLVYLPLESMD